MQGAQKLRSEVHLHGALQRRTEAQRRRWTLYEIIKIIPILFQIKLSKFSLTPPLYFFIILFETIAFQ